MICLAYLSSATGRMAAETLHGIIMRAQAKNGAVGVTGMLCHYDGSFLQFLEGEAEAVSEIYGVIKRDPRHTQLIEIYHAPISERIFADWTMAVVRPDEVGRAQQAFCKSLRRVELAGAGPHGAALAPFLETFRAWIR